MERGVDKREGRGPSIPGLLRAVMNRRLLYNACWEDPRIDRGLFGIGPGSRVLAITSAGCNVLDYLLDDPAEIVSVDMNPRQNAILELKLALIRRGVHDDLDAVFALGRHQDFPRLLAELEGEMPEDARLFWQRNRHYFSGGRVRSSFYFHGAAGAVAWLARAWLLGRDRRTRSAVMELIDASSLEEQRERYERVEPELFTAVFRGLLNLPVTLSLLGVPRAQHSLILRDHAAGVGCYLRAKLRRVFTEIPMSDNYFWRVYLTGTYSSECRPNYLKAENFGRLRARAHRVRVVTASVADFLGTDRGRFTHFALLDHQDWLAGHDPEGLEREWRAILDTSWRGARVLMRSAARSIDFVPEWVGDHVRFATERTAAIHLTDRVGTYGSLQMAEVL